MTKDSNLTLAKVVVETFTEDSIDEFVQLSHAEYGSSVATNADHARWKHIASPLGASTYIRLVVNDRTVGRAMLQPRLIYTESGQHNTACVTDVLINPEFRLAATNFIKLTKASGNVTSFDSVYHTSNERTEPFYRKFFRFPKPFSLRGHGLPVRFLGIFFKISKLRVSVLDWLAFPFRYLIELITVVAIAVAKFEISERLPEDDVLTTLCLKSLHDSGPIIARNKAFLKWRFIDAPLWGANIYCVERWGKFVGYVATRKLELNGLSYLVLIDYVLDTDISFFDRLVLRLWLIRQAIKSDVDILFTMSNPSSKAARICAGFPLICIPDKFLPHGTPVFFRANKKESRFLETEKSTHMTFADIDYF